MFTKSISILLQNRNVVLCLLFVFMLFPAPVGAQAVGNEEKPMDGSSLIAEFYATTYGVTVEEAEFRLSVQEETSELDRLLSEREPHSYAGLWIQHEPEFRIIVQFAEDIGSDQVKSYLSNTPYPELSEVRQVEYSLEYLETVQNTINDRIRSAEPPDKSQVASATNIIDNRIDVFVAPEANASERSAVAFAAGIDGVYVTEVASMPVPAQETRAGQDLSTCTLGWNVTYNGQQYMSTAAHCGSVDYNGITLAQVASWYSGNQDLQLLTVPTGYTAVNGWEWERNGTISRNSTTEEVGKNGTVGRWVCKIGKTTEWQCGTIAFVTYYYHGGLFAYANIYTCGGDSGGPVLTGIRAYGMTVAHSNNLGGGCGSNLIYMPVDSFWEKGVHVMTSP